MPIFIVSLLFIPISPTPRQMPVPTCQSEDLRAPWCAWHSKNGVGARGSAGLQFFQAQRAGEAAPAEAAKVNRCEYAHFATQVGIILGSADHICSNAPPSAVPRAKL